MSFSTLNLTKQFNNFYNYYPFLKFDNLIDYFLLFGGIEEYINISFHSKNIEEILKDIAESNLIEQLPFFLMDDSFKNLLIKVAKGDAKVNSSFIKSKTSLSFKDEILKELIENEIVYLEYSREKPLKGYVKQKIKKELKNYTIQNKIRFTKPFYHFFFSFIANNISNKYEINTQKIILDFYKYKNRIISFYFEEMSKELLKKEFTNVGECYSYWDKFSEFDIYCKINNKYLIGESKYTNKPVTKFELLKLEDKIEKSQLKKDYIALFSKSGFSKELEKLKKDNLFLYDLNDFKKLLESID